MRLRDNLLSTFVVFTLVLRAQAHRQCGECIPLENLLTKAYGIELAADGLYSAVAFHNGTMEYITHNSGSTAYLALMQSILSRQLDHPPQSRNLRNCLQERPNPSRAPFSETYLNSFDHSFFSFLIALFSLPKELWKWCNPRSVFQDLPIQVNPSIQLFKAEMEALPHFSKISAEQRSHISVSLAIPAWLMGTEEACQVIEAAAGAFRQVEKPESPPSAAYTALGYELCRRDYEAFVCSGPGRLMTVEFESDLTTLSLVRTPLTGWFFESVTFSISRDQSHDALVKRINSFVDTLNPDMVTLAGTDADVPHLQNAVLQSRAGPRLIEHPSIPVQRAVVMGAARAIKFALESQYDDCDESGECLERRRQADQITGKYSIPRTSVWPAIGPLWGGWYH